MYLKEDPFKEYSEKELGVDIRPSLSLFRILDPNGNVLPDREKEFSEIQDKTILNMLKYMITSRILDEWLLKLQRMGKVALYAPSKGEEAAYVGSSIAMGENDWITTGYRDLPAIIARGYPLESLIDRAMNNSDDPHRGKEFILLASKKHRLLTGGVPVGSQITIGTGFSIAAKLKGEDFVTLIYFGEGATSRGEFHWSLNFASLMKSMTIFMAVNNQYAISVPFHKQSASKTIAIKALAYGMKGYRVDGNDAIAMYYLTKRLREYIKREPQPILVEAVTYRMGSHTTADDPTKYRPQSEVKFFEKYDPLRRLSIYVLKNGLLSEKEYEELWKDYEERIRKLIEKCMNKPELPPTIIFENVYSQNTWIIEEELREFIDFLEWEKRMVG